MGKVPLILIGALSLFGTLAARAQLVSDTIKIPEARCRIIYPAEGTGFTADRSVEGNILVANVRVKLDSIMLHTIAVTHYDSVNALARRWEGKEWDISGDADEAPETGKEFLMRKTDLQNERTHRYFSDFTTVGGHKFGNRRARSASAGIYYCRSYTYIGDFRILIEMTTAADSLSRKVEESVWQSLSPEDRPTRVGETRVKAIRDSGPAKIKREEPSKHSPDFYGVVQRAVSDSLRSAYDAVLRTIRIERTK